MAERAVGRDSGRGRAASPRSDSAR
jgi:hypothetical protein